MVTIDPPATVPKLHETGCCVQDALFVLPLTDETDVPTGMVAERTVWVAVAFAKVFLNLTMSSPVLFEDRTLGTEETNKQFACVGLTCEHVLALAALPPDAKASNEAAVAAAARPKMPRPRVTR
ncbi:MAG: hypothetical protein ACTHNB_01075 [Gaiellaceae bacterium]